MQPREGSHEVHVQALDYAAMWIDCLSKTEGTPMELWGERPVRRRHAIGPRLGPNDLGISLRTMRQERKRHSESFTCNAGLQSQSKPR